MAFSVLLPSGLEVDKAVNAAVGSLFLAAVFPYWIAFHLDPSELAFRIEVISVPAQC